jgi:hypothetical protein
MFATIFAIGFFAALAKLILCLKVLGWRRTARYGAMLDFLLSMLLAWTFFGTLTGMAIACVGAVFLSLMLWLIKPLARALGQVQEPTRDIWDALHGGKSWLRTFYRGSVVVGGAW